MADIIDFPSNDNHAEIIEVLDEHLLDHAHDLLDESSTFLLFTNDEDGTLATLFSPNSSVGDFTMALGKLQYIVNRKFDSFDV